MKEHIITTVGEYFDHVFATTSKGDLFRGVTNSKKHDLIPSVGRRLKEMLQRGGSKKQISQAEIDSLRIFRLEARNHLKHEVVDDWEWLAIAQHHGLPTRLMDWTLSAGAALFFAAIKDKDHDGAVYVLSRDVGCVAEETTRKVSPFKANTFTAYLPRHISPRIRAQSGLFTIHPDPTSPPIEKLLIQKIIIPAAKKASVLKALDVAGINRKVLFPDIDGLASWIDWSKFMK